MKAPADAVHRPVELLHGDATEHPRERRLHAGVEPAPERKRASDDVLPEPALRLVDGARRAVAERRPLEGRANAELDEAVAALVHRREERVEVGLVVARREPDVAEAERGHEGMDRAVEAEGVPGPSEPLDELPRERLLRADRERAVHEPVVLLGHVLVDERDQVGLERVEDASHVLGAHPALPLVEHDVVGVVVRREALDPAKAELEDALQPGAEALEIVVLPCRDPGRVGVRRRSLELGGELGRDLPRLLPVAARHANQARVVRVVGQGLPVRGELVGELADPIVDSPHVQDAGERLDLGRSRRLSSRRHPDLEVPGEELLDPGEVLDLGEVPLQLCEGLLHARGLYPRANDLRAVSANALPSHAYVTTTSLVASHS